MKAPKSYKQMINRAMKEYKGKLPRYFFDHPSYDLYLINSKKNYKRHKEKNVRD
jgi:hypothetical protein